MEVAHLAPGKLIYIDADALAWPRYYLQAVLDVNHDYNYGGRGAGDLVRDMGEATLWLQVRYLKVFGGTWSTSPDSSDFHDFTGPNIYAPE